MGKTIVGRASQPVLLVIGNIASWVAQGLTLPRGDGIHFHTFADLTPEIFWQIDPDVVLSGLINHGFDAVDVAQTLGLFGFTGRYRVVTDQIPKPRIVLGDIRTAAPSIDFDLINLGDGLQESLGPLVD